MLNPAKDPNMKKWKEETREKSQQAGGGGDRLAYKQESGERNERVKRSNSRGGVAEILQRTQKKKNSPPKVTSEQQGKN